MRGSNWNLECHFLWREKNRKTRRKPSEQGREQQQTQPACDAGNRTPPTLLGGQEKGPGNEDGRLKCRIDLRIVNSRKFNINLIIPVCKYAVTLMMQLLTPQNSQNCSQYHFDHFSLNNVS